MTWHNNYGGTVVPINRTKDTGEDLFVELSPQERQAKILEYYFPRLCNDIGMIVRRPFQLFWDPTTETASTDCKTELCLSPWFFIEGHAQEGFGSAYHECGHMLWSSYGAALLEKAQRQGGDRRMDIANIILDRKDDMLTADYAPGFADTLRRRLEYIFTKSHREFFSEELGKAKGDRSQQELRNLLRHLRPQNVFEDFLWAAKWHRRPRFKATFKAMKYLSRTRLLGASEAELLWISERIHQILDDAPEQESQDGRSDRSFVLLLQLVAGAETDKGRFIDPELIKALKQAATLYVGRIRNSGLQQLKSRLSQMEMIHPGPLSVGKVSEVPIKEVRPDVAYTTRYAGLRESVRDLVNPLVKRLRKIDTPSEFTIYGQDEGDLDLTESARIATGLNGYHEETVTERNIDAELHLALDCSGSMYGDKLEKAKQIATVFSEAIPVLEGHIHGSIWAFSSEAIYDYGPPRADNGFVSCDSEAGNSDTHMLKHVGSKLAKSRRRRRVLIVLCDDGPDDMEEAKRLSHMLLARGIIVVHLLVGVHGTPQIYPFEILYTSMEECLEEFGNLMEIIIKHLK